MGTGRAAAPLLQPEGGPLQTSAQLRGVPVPQPRPQSWPSPPKRQPGSSLRQHWAAGPGWGDAAAPAPAALQPQPPAGNPSRPSSSISQPSTSSSTGSSRRCRAWRQLILKACFFYLEGTGAQVAGLSTVAIQNNSDVIKVRYLKDLNLEVLLNQKVISFSKKSWMDPKGLFLHSTADQNITVMFSSGSGVEIRGRGGFLTPTVLLPEKFMNHTQGLCGVMNGNTEVISRDWLDHPNNARKNGTNDLTCNEGYELTERICQVTGACTLSCVLRTVWRQ
ncbi:sushi domain-containing protein 2 isoform 2-T2 [Amazona ochrocephala]